jgi:acetylglutamate/LysW-gamma-L-alpha-aminoadipate kinase
MRVKLLGAAEAIAAGVGRVVLADSRGEGPVRAALAGRGTVIADWRYGSEPYPVRPEEH